MDTFDAISTKLEVKDYSGREVPREIKMKILEAARLTGSGINSQNWRFVLIEESEGMKTLAKDSTSGSWVAGANFAVIVLTNPKYNFHSFDAGRAVQDMQLAAWNEGVGSRVYTGFDRPAMARDFSLPADLNLTVVVGFGYPAKRIIGRKNRKPLDELAFAKRYGEKLRR